MSIPESQLETWCNQGAVTTAKATHESLRRALQAFDWPTDARYDVYLQGSYRNSTNIYGDSDVDIVVQLNSTLHRDLSALTEAEREEYKRHFSPASYFWDDFRNDVIAALRDYYGTSAVIPKNKCIRVEGSTGRLPSDVVVALQYRKYKRFLSYESQEYSEGMTFKDLRTNRWLINYPKLHYQHGTEKNSQSATNGNFKPTVRLFKNFRNRATERGFLDEAVAPSYFVECFVWNGPNRTFSAQRQDTLISLLRWMVDSLNEENASSLLCQNKVQLLFGSSPEQWSIPGALALVRGCLELWENY